MKALIVSRLTLSDRIIRELRESGIDSFADYFEKKDTWKTPADILEVAKEEGCDAVVIVSSFYATIELLSAGIKRVYVIIPRYATPIEIAGARIYAVEGETKLTVRDV